MRSHREEAPDIAQDFARLTDTMHTIERRLLQLVEAGTQRTIPLEDIATELSLLGKEMERAYLRIEDLRDRRDLTFTMQEKVQRIDRHCVWVYRRIQAEQSFFGKWRLETKLRALVSAEAFAVYGEIMEVEALEREQLMQTDADVTRRMLGEYTRPLVRLEPQLQALTMTTRSR